MEHEQIRHLRHSLHLTQSQFGALFGKSLRTVMYWEAGDRTPPARDQHALKILARALTVLKSGQMLGQDPADATQTADRG